MSKPLTRRRHSKEQQQSEKSRLTSQGISTQNEPIYTDSSVSTAGNVQFYHVHSQMQKDGQQSFAGSAWDKVSQASTIPLMPSHHLQQDIWHGSSSIMPTQSGASHTTGTADPWNWDIETSQANQIASQTHMQQPIQNYDIYPYHQQDSTEQAPIQMSVPNHWAPVEQAQPLQANINQQQAWNYQPNYFTENNSNNNSFSWQNEQQHNVNEYHQWYGNPQSTISQTNVHNQQENLSLLNQHSSVWDWDKHWTANTGTDSIQQLVQTDSVSSSTEIKTLQSDPENIEANSVIGNANVQTEFQDVANSSQSLMNFTEVSSGTSDIKNCYSNVELNDSHGGLSAFFNDSLFTDSVVPTQNSHKNDKNKSFLEEQAPGVLHNSDIQNDQQKEQDNRNIHDTSKSSPHARTDFNSPSKGDKTIDDSNIHLINQEMKNLTLNTSMKHSENYSVEEPINQEVPEPNLEVHQLGSDASERLGGVGDEPEQSVPTTTYQNTEEPINQQVPDIVPVFTTNQSIVDKSTSISSSIVQQERGIVIRPREGSPFKPPSKQAHLLGNIVQQELDEDVSKTNITSSDHSVQEVNLETPPENLEQPLDMEMLSQQSWSASFHRHHSHQRCNNSPSATLWDSPDLPSVTLVPAAPVLSSQNEKTTVSSEIPQQNSIITSNCNPSAVPRQSPLGWEGSQPEVMAQPLTTNSLAIPSEHHGQITSDTASLAELDGVTVPSAPLPLAMELLQRTSPQGAGHTQQQNQPVSDQSSSDISHLHHDNHRNNSQAVGDVRHAALPPERHSRQETDSLSRQRIISGHHAPATEREEITQPRRDVSQRRDFLPNYQHTASEQPNRWDRGYQGSRHGIDDDQRRVHRHIDDRSTRSEIWDRRSDSRHYSDDKRYSSLDERDYFSERDRSRPSSRTSLSESIDGQERYYRDRDYRHGYYQDRGRTPTSESERGSWPSDRKYYRNNGYDNEMYNDRYGHYRRDDPYQQQANGYRGYSYDMYRQDPRSYYRYYDMYRYGYNNFNYGYFDELYRTDPRYHTSLNERYQEYYAQMARDSDYERVSVHSGRSSVNEEQRENQNRYIRDVDQNSIGGSEYSSYNQNLQHYESSYNYDFAESTRVGDRVPESVPPSRLTPTKFSCPHPVACFSPGGLLLTVFPSISTTSPSPLVQIHNVQELIGTEECITELDNFPGPLLRGKTHKNDVIQFCQKKIRQLKEKEVTDRESCILLWELMIRLLRQNGCVDGSDVAELLLNNHEILQPSTRRPTDIIHEDGALLDAGESARQVSSGDTPSPDEGIVVTHDRTILSTTDSLTIDKVTRKFREFLFFGGKQDALEWAMKHDLWGHALFLASKMDSRTYANVMKRFANSLAPNDPLQTLYQLMSGRQPASVTRVADEKWGDWRPHLAMILSNPSSRTEVDLRSITTLGDTLTTLGCLAAAHFCYLMAQVEFGSFSNKSSKLVLLGSSNLLPFQLFASNEAIQCTEVYEYAQSLANPEYLLPHLQSYKFIYATRLLEYGFPQEALHYCEVISLTFHKLSGPISPDLVSQVYELANKLKYHDPHFTQGQGELQELGDPAWLIDLQRLRDYVGEFTHSTDWNNSGNLSTSNISNGLDSSPQFTAESSATEQCKTTSADLQNTQNFQNYIWANQGGVVQLNGQPSSVQDVNLHQMTNGQYQFNYSNMQWNADTVQSEQKTEQFNSVEGGALEHVSSPTNINSTAMDYYNASTQQECHLLASSASRMQLEAAHNQGQVNNNNPSSSEEQENLIKREESESDTGLCSSAHSTPSHTYADDKQTLVIAGHKSDKLLNSCLKNSKQGYKNKNKKSIKFDMTNINSKQASSEKGKLRQAVLRRRRMITRMPLKGNSTDSSTEGSPNLRERGEKNKKSSLLHALGILKNNSQEKKTDEKEIGTDTSLKSDTKSKTFVIDEPYVVDKSETKFLRRRLWAHKNKSGNTSSVLKNKFAYFSDRSSDTERSSDIQTVSSVLKKKKKPPLIFGGTFPIDEPCDSMKDNNLNKISTQSKFVVTLNKKSRGSKHPLRLRNRQTYPIDAPCCSKSNVCHEHAKLGHDKMCDPHSGSCSSVQSDDTLNMSSPSRNNQGKIQKQNKKSSSTIHNSDMLQQQVNSKLIQRKHKGQLNCEKGLSKTDTNEKKISIVHTPSPLLTREHADSSNSGTRWDRRDSTLSNQSSGFQPSRSQPAASNLQSQPIKKSSVESTKKMEGKDDKAKAQVGRSWLGGIFSKFLPKAPNQMILPDDKNPAIVWDSVKNRWINTDEDEDDENGKLSAPPKDSELMKFAGEEMSSRSSISTTTQNRFQKPKVRGMRQNYVDVLNPSIARPKTDTTSDSLLSSMDKNVTSPDIFVPKPAAYSEENVQDLISPVIPTPPLPDNPHQIGKTSEASDLSPMMFDPAEFASRSGSNMQRPGVGRLARRAFLT